MNVLQSKIEPRWRFLSDPPLSGAENMSKDLSLLEELENSRRSLTVVRFYAWDRPTVSLGKHQQPSAAAGLGYCRRHGIPVVQRPTGGRAVLHADELTYAVVSNDPDRFPMHSLKQTYQTIALALQEGLSRLGIDTVLARPKRTSDTPPAAHSRLQSPCFATASRHELLCRGRKIAGSAQRRRQRAFLQHGSIPLAIDYAVMSGALNSSEDLLRATVISVSEAAGCCVGRERLEAALLEGFGGVPGAVKSGGVVS